MEITKISQFEGKKIRKTIYNGEWWLSVVDIIEALTDTPNARIYWGVMKNRLEKDEKVELYTICKQLKLEAQDGKMRETDCANPEGILRVIQSKKNYLKRVEYKKLLAD